MSILVICTSAKLWQGRELCTKDFTGKKVFELGFQGIAKGGIGPMSWKAIPDIKGWKGDRLDLFEGAGDFQIGEHGRKCQSQERCIDLCVGG